MASEDLEITPASLFFNTFETKKNGVF